MFSLLYEYVVYHWCGFWAVRRHLFYHCIKCWQYVLPDRNPIKFVWELWCKPLHSSVVWQITREETDGPKTPPRVSLPVQFVKKRFNHLQRLFDACAVQDVLIGYTADVIQEVAASDLGEPPSILTLGFSWFFSLPKGVTGCYLQLSHNRFLPDPLQFIIEKSPYHSSCWQFR
jgi:hypothetical protein